MIGKVRILAYLFEIKRYFHGGVMVCTGPVKMGGKPTDASDDFGFKTL